MAVRRLDPEQPPSFAFSPENMAWAKATIAKYPAGKQASAVIPLLWRAQEQEGWTTEPAIRAVADMLGMAYIRVYEIATFYTMFQLSPVGRKAHVQVCGTTPCMLRGAEELVHVCKRRIAEQPHVLSKDGDFSWEEVECLGVCANAPLVQIGKDTYEDLTPELLEKVLDGFAAGQPPKPGSQTGRQASCPTGGATTLSDPALYDGSGLGAWKKRFPEMASAGAPGAAIASATGTTGEAKSATAGQASAVSGGTSPAAAPVTLAESGSGAGMAGAAGAPRGTSDAQVPGGPASGTPASGTLQGTTAAPAPTPAPKSGFKAPPPAPAAWSGAPGTPSTPTTLLTGAAAGLAAAGAAGSTGSSAAPTRPAGGPQTAPAPAPAAAAGSGPAGKKPPLLSAPRDGKPDDLTLIWGVAEKLQEKLYAIGIWHFDQIARWTPDEVAWFENEMPGFKGRIARDKWLEQCEKLSQGWRPESEAGERPKG